MERGPHKGRLILPRLGNPQVNASALPKGQRPPTESYAIFSDVRRTPSSGHRIVFAGTARPCDQASQRALL